MKRVLLTLQDMFDLPTAELYNAPLWRDVPFVTIDSRSVTKGCLFVAIRGERFDGHTFAADAVKAGAAAVVVEKKALPDLPELKAMVVAVDDTTTALGDIAAAWRDKLPAKVFGITGSNGKTTTKDFLTVLCSAQFSTQSTAANDNNHIGVPLTILSANEKHQRLIAELGTNHFGEIPYTAAILRPELAMITNIGTSHIEFLKNRRGILKEKKALFTAAANAGGAILLNTDDAMLAKLKGDYKHVITYGFNGKPDIKGAVQGTDESGFPLMQIASPRMKLAFTAPLYGSHNAANLLAAVAAAIQLGCRKQSILDAIQRIKPSKQRLEVYETNSMTLIDDTYNANPESMKASLDVLGSITKRSRKIVVLGDMFELGEKAAWYHARLAAAIKRNGVTETLLTGKMMKELADALRKNNLPVKYYRSRKQLAKALDNIDVMNTAVLVKGSRGMKMEEFTAILKDRKPE